jgi:hypothetical protein
VSAGRPEDLVVGLFALALVPLIALRIWRGLRDGRLPIYRTHHEREDSRSKFAVLLVLHALTLLLMLTVAADLLLGLGLRERL